ncbi:hypothetical protein TSAR_003812 [Trichomalopsis sarcophagae]|uniref:BEN domain-containing protein n=1 Tax=Trichomalopsis sarcophagae TaxID=543379 RepID=A0A232ED01_9HYME|nr:hypothetical protein TSAR_003812 [Trichomalopsis sarcophagae]
MLVYKKVPVLLLIMASDPRLLVKNKECILVEFCNESNKLAVGYTCWLSRKMKSKRRLEDLVRTKEIIEISWPECNITTEKSMIKTMAKLSNDQWKPYAVKILGFGDWTTMSQEMESLISKNVQSTTKCNRHEVMKKSLSDEYVTDNKKKAAKKDKDSKEKDSSKLKKNLKKEQSKQRSNSILDTLLQQSSKDVKIIPSNDSSENNENCVPQSSKSSSTSNKSKEIGKKQDRVSLSNVDQNDTIVCTSLEHAVSKNLSGSIAKESNPLKGAIDASKEKETWKDENSPKNIDDKNKTIPDSDNNDSDSTASVESDSDKSIKTRNKKNTQKRKYEDTYQSFSESVSSEDVEPLSKRSKRQLQSDVEILRLENRNLKQELAHYKDNIMNPIVNINAPQYTTPIASARNESLAGNRVIVGVVDVALSNKESEQLKLNVKKTNDILQSLQLKCAVCEKSIERQSASTIKENVASSTSVVPLKQNEEQHNRSSRSSTYSPQLRLPNIENLFQYVTPSHENTENNSKSGKSLDGNTEKLEMLKKADTVTKPSNDDSVGSPGTPRKQDRDSADELSNDESSVTLKDNTETEGQKSTLVIEVKKEVETDEAFVNTPDKVDLGHGVFVNTSILENNIRKSDVRETIRDFVRTLFTDLECSKHSLSGKKGKEADSAKPELSKSKRAAIVDYVAKTFPSKNKDEIKALLDSTLKNKCNNATKKYRIFNKKQEKK